MMNPDSLGRGGGPSPRVLLVTALIVAVAMTRLLPHPPNFAPIGAMALFGGAYFARRSWALALPLAAMVLSDLALYWVRYDGYRDKWLVNSVFVYGSIALGVCLGFGLRGRVRAATVAAGALGSSLVFFFVTNFGAWLSDDWYPKTLDGLTACYAAGIPFHRDYGSMLMNAVAGDLFYSAVLFGAFAFAERRLPLVREPETPRDAPQPHVL